MAGRKSFPAVISGLFERPATQLVWFIALALAMRASVFGDLNYHADELLFFYIGQRMQDGLLPYVDIWDRKPPGLFLLYYAIASLSRLVLAYQLVATLFAALTALVICRMAIRFASPLGAMLAGALYLSLLPVFGGGGGQAAVFFNLFMALAAWLTLRSEPASRDGWPRRAALGAMACAGLAISFKQTALFEGIYFGCAMLFIAWKIGTRPAPLAKAAALMAATAALPMLAWFSFYAAAGHFSEFWHAMVTANLAKAYDPGGEFIVRFLVFARVIAPAALVAVAGLYLARKARGERAVKSAQVGPDPVVFTGLWCIVALGGAIAIPNLIDHYFLPLLVPLSLAAAPFFARNVLTALVGVMLIAANLLSSGALDYAQGMRSRHAMLALRDDVLAHDPHPRLFVFDGPVYLYALTGSHPPTPLVFPLHLHYLPELNVSHLDTMTEVRKLLAWQPRIVIVRQRPDSAALRNPEAMRLVLAYVRHNCPAAGQRTIYDHYGPIVLDVYRGCAAEARR